MATAVWVAKDTGDLRLLMEKSDVFDENSQPVKTGALRLTFDPPLWGSAPAPSPGPPSPPWTPACPKAGSAMPAFSNATGGRRSIIGDQKHQMVPKFTCSSVTACPTELARLCCGTKGCVAFSYNRAWGSGLTGQLFTDTRTNTAGAPGPGWSTWIMKNAPPSPPSPSPPAPAPEVQCSASSRFCQTLHLANATVVIKTPEITVSVWVELNAPSRGSPAVPHRDAGIVHVTATAAAGKSFSLKVSLEPYDPPRLVSPLRSNLGTGGCFRVWTR